MEQPNWWLFFVTAFIPLIVGFIWYNPNVFGKAWIKAADITEERAGSVTYKSYLLTYLFGVLAAYILTMFAVHQTSIFQLFASDPGMLDASTETGKFISDFMSEHGELHRSVGHGVIHGIELALFMGLAFIGIPALFERRSFRYTMIHTGYWIVSFALMGGILCKYF